MLRVGMARVTTSSSSGSHFLSAAAAAGGLRRIQQNFTQAERHIYIVLEYQVSTIYTTAQLHDRNISST